MKRTRAILMALLLALTGAVATQAGPLNDKVLNRPYTDLRRWHLGFSVGLHTQDMNFTHNGFVTEDGGAWYVDQPDFAPGFCVTGLFDYRLGTHFNFRFSPGLFFGNRNVKMIDVNTGAKESQNLKSTFIVLPLDIKFSGQRYHNSRPYLTAGVMPAIDVAKKQSDFIKLKSFDTYLTVGFGCDFYLPYFKLNPEIKFCFGLMDVIEHDRPDLKDDPSKQKITKSLSKATSKMFVLTFYFE